MKYQIENTHRNISNLPSLIKREDVLPLVVVDKVELLQGRHDVVLFYRGLLANLVDSNRGWIAVDRVVGIRRLVQKTYHEIYKGKDPKEETSNNLEYFIEPMYLICFLRSYWYLVGIQQDGQNSVGPVAAVGEQAQVGEWLLRTASLPLELGQFVAELDQELGETNFEVM